MAAASPVDVAVNPNNLAQRYILWGNGWIEAVGGAPPITGQATWYDRIDQPIAVALHITSWSTGAGYLLDLYGGIHEFNGAPDIGNGILAGVPYTNPNRNYVDWAWDPSGSGQGYVLSQYGQLHAFGGASAPPRSGGRWTWPAARKLQMQWSPTKYGVIMDLYGGLHAEFEVTGFSGGIGTYWRGYDYARDFVVTSWASAGNPGGYKLDLFGGVHRFGSVTGPIGALVPYRPGADVARAIAVVSSADPLKIWEVWSGGQQFEFASSTAPTVKAGGGTSEVQTVTITGSPTGGSFTLTYSGQTTAAIAHNASAATVDSALEALTNIGAGNVAVTGGPGPGTPWTVTFTGTLANTDVAQMTATSSLTGGTTPAVTVATTTQGEAASPTATVTGTTRPVLSWTYSDPQKDSQVAWELYVYTQAFVDANSMTDPAVHKASARVAESGINPTTRGVVSPVDLANGTYRMYVRAKDSADQWSAWSNYGWTQNIATPATPTSLTATPSASSYSTALSVSATTGGAANLIRFECSDDSGTTWLPVRGADAVTLAATTTATDYDPPQGKTRQYRAVAYATDPAVASLPSAVVSATLSTATYLLTAVDNSTLGGRVSVQEPVEWSRPSLAGIFQGLGADFPTVVSDGRPKARRSTVHVFTDTEAAWTTVEKLALADSVLVYRDPLGAVRYCRLVGDWAAALMPGAATRHLHTTDLPLVEVRPPHLAT